MTGGFRPPEFVTENVSVRQRLPKELAWPLEIGLMATSFRIAVCALELVEGPAMMKGLESSRSYEDSIYYELVGLLKQHLL